MSTAPISFSIVTVVRNAAAHIQGCLDSVAMQDHPHAEHLIIDGASKDDTQAIVQRMRSPRIQLFSEPDRGIYDAMNKGIARATGDYLIFLGADDRLADKAVLSDVAVFLERVNRPGLVYGNLQVRDANGISTIFFPPPPSEAMEFLIYGCLPHQATFAHRSLFTERVGLFDMRYRVHADYDWYLRAITTEGVEIRYLDRVLGSFFSGGTSSQLEKGQAELFAIQNEFPPYQSPEWMARRLKRFQDETLNYRLQLAALAETPLIRVTASVKRTVKQAARRAATLWRHGTP